MNHIDRDERTNEMREFFNEKAPENNYDTVHASLMASKDALIDALPEGTARVLDLGVGTGLALFRFFKRFPEGRVTGIDIAEKMLEVLASRPFADKVTIRHGDFFREDYGTGYDAVISSSALSHFEEDHKELLYAKIFACLRPGGVFLNSDKCMNTLEEQLERFHEFYVNSADYRHLDTPLAVETERKLLTAAGFTDFSAVPLTDKGYFLVRAVKP